MKKVFFRFYEELNRYLPPDIRKIWFDLNFEKETTIGDVLHMLGVPEEEVDLILTNQRSVGFCYLLQALDRVSVYPVFESFDVSCATAIREKPLRNMRFVCDVHLGRLCKYLRMLGFDTLYSDQYTPEQLVTISVREHRILLSKDRKLTGHPRVTHAYWIRSTDSVEQLKDLVRKLDLQALYNPLSRCLTCNSELEPIEKSKIQSGLQERTERYFDEFFICRKCRHLYWKGSHYDNMLEFISRNILDEAEL